MYSCCSFFLCTMTVIDRINALLGREQRTPPPAPSLRPEELQRLFTANCRCFHDLLRANNNVLETMAEMEKALRDGRTLSMAFIRSKSTAVAINVYKIVHNLIKLSEGRHSELQRVFSRLQQEIDTLLDGEKPPCSAELIIPLERISRQQVDLVGEKMAHLGEVAAIAGMLIPPGFAITSTASRLFWHRNHLYPAINHILQRLDIANLEDLYAKSAAIRQKISSCPLPPELETVLFQHYDALVAATTPDIKVAVRSSALGEDLGQASFAGIYHTELHVGRNQLADAYKSVLASKFSPRAISYRLARGYRHEETEMCVGCLAMIEAATSGICYSQSISGSIDTLDVFSAGGSAKGIVDGTRSTNHWLIERSPPHRMLHCTLTDSTQEALLSDQQLGSLSAIALTLENHFGTPQDIEWSIDPAGTLSVLQSRPISISSRSTESDAQTPHDDDRLLLRGGVTGCAGAGSGPVCIVRTIADMLHFPSKAVLVVAHPLPEWAPLLKRAVALVAETGSEAGHLATISREFGLPSLFAVDQATEQLIEGETVTVDATSKAVYRGRIDELLTQPVVRPNLMEGSPVQQCLINVLRLITPLHLTDPASPEFSAINCRTMHDITRFCHEQSIREMFAFGRRYHFDTAAAKRLRDTLPLAWWVINLGDGFSARYEGDQPDITITDIVSRPMLALWHGMHAVPWKGPPQPPLRTKLSFLFQSIRQTILDPALSSALMQKNYFIISKNYCNLSVRLGYHYAMIEAQVGSRPVDQYITFRFKGGAAGEEQRMRRVELLADILETYNFQIDLIGDALTARVERMSEKFLYDRLKILGYLTVHTRQIDMVMTNAQEHPFFRAPLIQEIEDMLNNDQ